MSDPIEDGFEPRRTQIHEFCVAWTNKIAEACGGLTYYERSRICMLLHGFRKAVRDLDHPEPKPVTQTSMFDEATP